MKSMENTADSPDAKLAALEQRLELEPTNAFCGSITVICWPTCSVDSKMQFERTNKRKLSLRN